jgi:hypothetical protein
LYAWRPEFFEASSITAELFMRRSLGRKLDFVLLMTHPTCRARSPEQRRAS